MCRTTGMTTRKKIDDAITSSFVDQHLEYAPSRWSRIAVRDIAAACTQWCEEHGLYRPSRTLIAEAIHGLGASTIKSRGQRLWQHVQWRDPNVFDDFLPIANRDVLKRLCAIEPLIPMNEFCDVVRIGKTTLYEMRQRGVAPRIVQVGARYYIRAFDALEWSRGTGRHMAIINLANWLDAEVDRPCRRAAKAYRVASAAAASTAKQEK